MTNLLRETQQAVEDAGKSWSDIDHIGSADGALYVVAGEFAELADFEYDSSFGAAEIGGDLVVLFDDKSWLEREEYDGAEWWTYKQPPKLPRRSAGSRPIVNLGKQGGGRLWPTVEGVNAHKETL